MTAETPTSEQQIRDNLGVLKSVIDTALLDQEELPVLNGNIQADHIHYGAGLALERYDGSSYSVRFYSDIDAAAEGESTPGSWLQFDGDTLTVTDAEINVARKHPEGNQGGFNRRVTASRLPGFVASITMQVVREMEEPAVNLPEEVMEDIVDGDL